MAKIKLLLITAYFPPIASVASQRLYSFVKYLPTEHYEIRVIAHSDNYVEQPVIPGLDYKVYYLPNPTLIKRAKFDDKPTYFVHKIRAIYNYLLILLNINTYRGWSIQVEKKFEEIYQNWKPDILFASSPPYYTLDICEKISKTNNIPFISDLRDGLTNNAQITWLQTIFIEKIEKIIAINSKCITTVSKPHKTYLLKKYNNLKLEIHEIRNGFDFITTSETTFNQEFTISFYGSFYGVIKPDNFFSAISELLETNCIKKISINFVGVSNNFQVPETIKNYCNIIPNIPYDKIANHIQNSDALLLILYKFKHKGVYSGKLFDYLGSLKPIIALVDKTDVAAQLIEECNAGFIADSENIEEIKSAILQAYETWRTKTTLPYNVDLINQHHRSAQAARLDKHIKKILNRG
jgi:glycosyltransferase involved in cell wall biosynthesis